MKKKKPTIGGSRRGFGQLIEIRTKREFKFAWRINHPVAFQRRVAACLEWRDMNSRNFSLGLASHNGVLTILNV